MTTGWRLPTRSSRRRFRAEGKVFSRRRTLVRPRSRCGCRVRSFCDNYAPASWEIELASSLLDLRVQIVVAPLRSVVERHVSDSRDEGRLSIERNLIADRQTGLMRLPGRHWARRMLHAAGKSVSSSLREVKNRHGIGPDRFCTGIGGHEADCGGI